MLKKLLSKNFNKIELPLKMVTSKSNLKKKLRQILSIKRTKVSRSKFKNCAIKLHSLDQKLFYAAKLIINLT